MRGGIMLAAALSLLMASGARADEWCGYAAHANAMIECGYSSVAECESVLGKTGTCFIDPDVARNVKRAAPMSPAPVSKARSNAARA